MENIEPTSSKKKPCEWNALTTFPTRQKLDEYIASHECFYEHTSNDSADGRTTYYYCNKVPARSARLCPVKLKVFENNTSLSFGVSVTTFVHDHSAVKTTKKPIFSEVLKKEIFTLKTDFSMKPRLICKQLIRTHKGETMPNVVQVRRIIQDQYAALIPPTISYGQLHEWCESEKKVPQDIDKTFVLDHFHNSKEDSFAFVSSTLRLLRNAATSRNVTTDGTYKIIWQGFPLIGVGFLDRMQRFHIIAICVTARERAEEYKFVFKAVKDAIYKHTNTIFKPDVLISDAAPAIRNAFFEVFEEAKQNVICYIHVQRNISKASYRSKSNKDPIMKDFLILQNAANATEFDKVCNLFIRKWTTAEPEFCAYFQSEWLQDDTKNWYNGYSPFVPAHNNANEGFNLHIKRDYTMRERLALNVFKVTFSAMINDMSVRYDPSNPTGEVKKIRMLPDITNQMYEAAHSWYSNPDTLIGEINNGKSNLREFFVASSKYTNQATSASLAELQAIQEREFDDFDDYISNGFAMAYSVQLKNDALTCFQESVCECKSFHSHFICKHIIGLAFHAQLKKLPKLADSKIISKKQPRGRTPKAKKALIKQ